jgi:glucosylceramidase
MKTDEATLKAHAQYFVKFVQGYKEQGINVEVVAPQNEPNFDQNYPSCIWDKGTFTSFIGKYLGPAIKDAGLGTKIMLGTMSNGDSGKDPDIAAAVLADSTAKSFCAIAGVQWGMLDSTKTGGMKSAGLPIWATEHKCGNYPWNPSGSPAYNSTQAPNDQAYAVESWGYIRDAIAKVGVTSYNAWNMVLDKKGLGIDTTRDWKQNALLVADSGQITQTPTYYVFRHFSQFVDPGAKVVKSSANDAIAFKNPDNTIVLVMYNSGAAKTATVSMGGKKVQFPMPASGWATIKR